MINFGAKREALTCIDTGTRAGKDILFVVAFLGCIFAFFVISSEGFAKGNPSILIKSSNEIPSTASESLKARMRSDFGRMVGQMKSQWRVMLGALFVAIVAAFVWVHLLRLFTKLFIYVTLLLGITLLLVLSIYMISLGVSEPSKYLKILGIVGVICCFILVCITIALRKKIDLTAVIMKEATGGLEHSPSLVLIATGLLVLFASFSVFWIYSFVYVYTVPNDELRNGLYFNVFAYFWIAGVILGIFQYTVSGAMAGWYFSRSSATTDLADSFSPALASLVRACTLSLGSIAFGTLIVAIVAFVHFLLNQARKKTDNKIARFVISCIQCCLACVQAIVQYINKFAFVYCAMYGDSFCTSAKNVSNLMSRVGFSAIVVDMISEFLLFVGKLFGTALTTLICLIILDKQNVEISPLTVSIVIIVSFTVFQLFAHILGMGVDATFVCYMEDLERNGANKNNLAISPPTHTELQAHYAKGGYDQ